MLQSSPVRFRPVKYIVMELEGTVVDSLTVTNDMVSEYLKKFNKILSPELKTKILGRLSGDLYDILKSTHDILDTFEEFEQQMEVLKEKHFPKIQFMPGLLVDFVLYLIASIGAQDLLTWFYEHDIPMGLVSNCSKEDFNRKITNCGDFIKKFRHITTRDEVDRGKPYPDLFVMSASKFVNPAKPKYVLVFESTLHGAEAARSAGMQVVLVGTCFTEGEKQRPTKAINNLCDFDPSEFGLP